MRIERTAVIIAILMFAASVSAVALKPTATAADVGNAISLETIIPKEFAGWREEPQERVEVVNPETQALLNKLYSQIVSRVYVNPEGYRIMLSLAYGADQRGSMQVHKPEVCYPAQGFTLVSNQSSVLETQFGTIPVRRLFTTMGPRQEPVTYWFTTGDTVIKSKLQKRLTDLRFGLTGQIPDGLIFRVSSIDADQANANKQQDNFVNMLLQSVSPADRKRLSGLGPT